MNLEEILKKHKLWWDGKKEGERAYLRGADLRKVNFRDADLRGANLRETDLRDADLRGADLRKVNFRDAYLRGANLRETDLRDADLRGADLRGANLKEADLQEADLQGAYLRGADIRGANLYNVATDRPIIQIIGSKHTLFFLDGVLQIGCEKMPLDEWMEKGKELAKKTWYDNDQIAEYRRYIEMLKSFEEGI